MKKATATKPRNKKTRSTLVVRMDRRSKSILKQAAERRGISVSDFVRFVTTPVLTESQKRLGAIMRGEA